MSQVIAVATLDAFQNHLTLARRRTDIGERAAHIMAATDQAITIVAKVASVFHSLHPKPLDQMSRAEWDQLRKEFFADTCKVRLCFEGSRAVGGYVVLNGELLGFHNFEKGKGSWMLDHAINDGAERLTCFEGSAAERLYRSRGFFPVMWEPNYEAGGPNVLLMGLDK